MKNIELKGGFTKEFDENIVEDTLLQIDSLIEEKLLLGVEDFQVKMRLFLKLKEELDNLHTLNQSSNYFTEGSWNYKGESLSRRG